MARLTVMGPWIGPGEERTARHLESALPESWEIIAGRKLPGERSDVDLIVVASNLIFVIDEGRRFAISGVSVEGNKAFTTEELTPLPVAAHAASRDFR